MSLIFVDSKWARIVSLLLFSLACAVFMVLPLGYLPLSPIAAYLVLLIALQSVLLFLWMRGALTYKSGLIRDFFTVTGNERGKNFVRLTGTIAIIYVPLNIALNLIYFSWSIQELSVFSLSQLWVLSLLSTIDLTQIVLQSRERF
jgi:hypothetical protein